MTRAFIFPGQGSQTVGMGKALAEPFPQARAVFDEVDAALSQKLSSLMWEGPAEELTLTANAQPALMAVSLAAMRVLEAEAGLDLKRHAAFVAGHSLGEYSALAAAGLSLDRRYGAAPAHPRQCHAERGAGRRRGRHGGLLGLEYEAALEVAPRGGTGRGLRCRERQRRRPGGGLRPQGRRRAGHRPRPGEGRQARRDAPRLRPFHCALMAPAADAMREALARVARRAPGRAGRRQRRGRGRDRSDAIRDALVRQVTGTVRWRESVAYMAAAGRRPFYEVGAGKVLTGLVKRIAAGATATVASARPRTSPPSRRPCR